MDKKKSTKSTMLGGRSGASSRSGAYSQTGYRSHVHSSMGTSSRSYGASKSYGTTSKTLGYSYGTTSKHSLSSMSKKSLSSESSKKLKEPLIMENGMDITPKTLLPQGKRAGMKKGPRAKGERTDSVFQASVYGSGTGPTSFNQQFSQHITLTSSVLDPKGEGGSPFTSSAGSPTPTTGFGFAPLQEPVQDTRPLIVTTVSTYSNEDLDKDVDISLEETDTMWIFGLESTWVDPDSQEAAEVVSSNQRYQKVKDVAGSESFTSRGMQTFNDAQKCKQMQTEHVTTAEIGVHASTSDIFDTYQELEEEQLKQEDKEDDNLLERLSPVKTKSPRRSARSANVHSSNANYSVTPSTKEESALSTTMLGSTTMDLSMLDTVLVNENSPGVVLVEKIDPTNPNNHPILLNPNLLDSLRLMERVILQNIYHGKQALYRNLIPLRDPDQPPIPKMDRISISTPHLEKLWNFGCSLTRRYKVTCLAWNKSNEDILAVGYGSFHIRNKGRGMICCWSLKNTEYPERVFYASAGVSSLDFASNHSSLLAAGLLNGSILLYDIRSTKHDPVIDSKESTYRHIAPIWHVSWVVKEGVLTEGNYSECLVSISMDGTVLEWSIQKGLESSQLMHLKRMLNKKEKKTINTKPGQKKSSTTKGQNARKQQQKAGAASASKPHDIGRGHTYISQQAPGMGLAFSPSDSNIYLACTEEGYVYKCSCSYNEQFLETYEGHNGPVYRVTWSPSMEDYFLTCSADWSVKLWHQDRTTPIQSFSSASKAINNVCWSPLAATIFGCVSQGRVEIWDMHHTHLDPVIVHRPLGLANQTCLTFASKTKMVIVGDSEGEVTVYMMKNLPTIPQDQKVAFQDAIKAMLKKENKH